MQFRYISAKILPKSLKLVHCYLVLSSTRQHFNWGSGLLGNHLATPCLPHQKIKNLSLWIHRP